MFQTYNERTNLNAEIWQALNLLDKNYWFSSANGDSDRFKKMLPDSQIVVKYSQEETNMLHKK